MVWRQGRSLNGDAVVFCVVFFCLVCVCCCWMQDDCVARELPSEVRSMEISRSNDRRMCNSEDKWCGFGFLVQGKFLLLGF
jgi:hypothetical protein